VVAGSADWPEIAALRTRVFVDEQGVPPEIEQDDADATAVHAVSRDEDGRLVATGRLLERAGTALIGRMAADESVRGRGHGAAVLAELHRQAALRGFRQVELHAQITARGFYERAGYTAVGEEYEEAGIAHVTMRRSLDDIGADIGSDIGTADPRGARGGCDRSVRGWRDTFCQTLGVDPSQCEDRSHRPSPAPPDS
jgi:predicted GNAT family N-acyltransferase